MKTMTDTSYDLLTEEQARWSAANRTIALGIRPDYDGFYEQFPNVLNIGYMWPRTGNQSKYDQWAIDFGRTATYEDGYLHDFGFPLDPAKRHRAPPVTGRFYMKLDSVDYLDFLAFQAIGLIDHTFWFGPTPPAWKKHADFVLVDLVQWYWDFDGGMDNVQITEEYTGVTLDDEHPRAYNCVSSTKFIQAALDTEFGVGVKQIIPNYGNLWFTSYTDDRTLDMLSYMENGWVMSQVDFDLDVDDESMDNGGVDEFIARLDALHNTRNIKHLGLFFDDTFPFDHIPTDKGKRQAAGLYYLTEHENQYCGYKAGQNATDPGAHVDVYHWNAMLTSGYLGSPTKPYTTDGRLYEREYDNGKVYLWTKEAKTDAPTEKVLTIPAGAFELKEDGSLSALTPGAYSLWSNDALILIERHTKTIKMQPTASPLEEFPLPQGQSHFLVLDDGVLTPTDASFISTTIKDVADELAFPIPSDLHAICELTFGFRYQSDAGTITPAAEVRLQNDDGEIFAVNELDASQPSSLANKQHTFYGLDVNATQFQNNRIIVRFVARDDADNTNGKVLVAYAI